VSAGRDSAARTVGIGFIASGAGSETGPAGANAAGTVTGWPGARPPAPGRAGKLLPASVWMCSRSRFQVPLMNDHASAGRVTCGVVRTLTPVPRLRSVPWLLSALEAASGSSSMCRLCQLSLIIASCSGSNDEFIRCGGMSPTITTPRRL
jgi:hypothetical protein